MRAIEILRQFQRSLPAAVHSGRAKAVLTAAHTLLRSGRLSLTALGRAIAERTTPKHGIKRIDRLLGNTKLHAEKLMFYRAISARLLGNAARPIIIVDWTAVTPKLWALIAAVAFDGRALILYAETHSIHEYAKRHVHATFLRRVKSVLPASCRPIIVTDAGFRTPWMRQVAALGWDYVGRIRHGTMRHFKGQRWMSFGPLWRRTRTRPTDLGHFVLGQKARFACRLVGLRKPNSVLTPTSLKVRRYRYDRGTTRARRNALEPWLLATSLEGPAANVTATYAQRMKVEETFRDTKSHRVGMCLCHMRTSSPDRADVLLLLASLAHATAILIGIAAEELGLQRRFQANTVTNRRVLSLATLGRLVATSGELMLLHGVAVPWERLLARVACA